MICIQSVFVGVVVGIVKISDELHEEVRKASTVMSRSINAQAEFWIKVGMQAELNPQLSFNELILAFLKSAQVSDTPFKGNQQEDKCVSP